MEIDSQRLQLGGDSLWSEMSEGRWQRLSSFEWPVPKSRAPSPILPSQNCSGVGWGREFLVLYIDSK